MIRQQEIKVKVGETNQAITGFAGAGLLAKVAEETGLLLWLDRFVSVKLRQRGYAPSATVLDLMLVSLLGGECIDDLEVLRRDLGLKQLLGRQVIAPSTAHDFLRRLGRKGLQGLGRVRKNLLETVAKATGETTATLDCDATFIPSGVQGAQMSYKGEPGWMPMLAFWAETDMVVHEEFRTGNASPGGDALPFLKKAVAQLPRWIKDIRMRSDSAWYQAELMDWCHDKGIDFCITASRDAAVKALFAGVAEAEWKPLRLPRDPGDPEEYIREWAHETVHTLNDSQYSYRIILLRKRRRYPNLIDGEYVYSAIITNMDLGMVAQIRWHRERCNCENHIKELKHGFSLRVLPSADFGVNAAWLRIGTLAYNLFCALKRLRLGESWRYRTIKTVRFRLLVLPALLVHHARQWWLRLPRGHPHLQTFRRAFA